MVASYTPINAEGIMSTEFPRLRHIVGIPKLSGMAVTDLKEKECHCRKCGILLDEGSDIVSWDTETGEQATWCEKHFNRYEHYYGLDKPID